MVIVSISGRFTHMACKSCHTHIENQPICLVDTKRLLLFACIRHVGQAIKLPVAMANVRFWGLTQATLPVGWPSGFSDLKRKRQAATQSLPSAAQSKYHWPQPATPATHRQEAELTCQKMANTEPAGNSQNHVCNSCPQPSPLRQQNNRTKQATATAWPKPATSHTDH